jgi:hypothetical protein
MLGALRKGSKVPCWVRCWFQGMGEVGFHERTNSGGFTGGVRIRWTPGLRSTENTGKHQGVLEAWGKHNGADHKCCVQTESIEHDQMNQHNQLHIV